MDVDINQVYHFARVNIVTMLILRIIIVKLLMEQMETFLRPHRSN